jgi:hypothetical protein
MNRLEEIIWENCKKSSVDFVKLLLGELSERNAYSEIQSCLSALEEKETVERKLEIEQEKERRRKKAEQEKEEDRRKKALDQELEWRAEKQREHRHWQMATGRFDVPNEEPGCYSPNG